MKGKLGKIKRKSLIWIQHFFFGYGSIRSCGEGFVVTLDDFSTEVSSHRTEE
ncbi:MAG: hypothetical protein ACTIKD_13610 [Sphingobacteriaceae bacterium]